MVQMIRSAFLLATLLSAAPNTALGRVSPWGLSASASHASAWSLRGGASSSADDYAGQLEAVKSQVLESIASQMDELRKNVEQSSQVVPDFGPQAETICNQALETFAATAPAAETDNALQATLYDRKLQELEVAVDAPLQVLYLKQLALVRETALQRYRAATVGGSAGGGTSDYEAMLQADAAFVRDAEALTRDGGADWEYASERAFLQAVMNNLAASGQKVVDVQMSAATQQQTAMQFLQSQQQMIQQLQMQLYGQTSPWNVGVAYRIPDTNFNLQGSYQQGRANVQLSCVPDEYAPFLGPNGFTNGVGPGNLGLSLNLSV